MAVGWVDTPDACIPRPEISLDHGKLGRKTALQIKDSLEVSKGLMHVLSLWLLLALMTDDHKSCCSGSTSGKCM